MTSQSHWIPVVRMNRPRWVALFLCAAAFPTHLFAQSYDIPWHTIDGGGNTVASTGGSFAVSGTIGQPDASSFASPMSGGSYSVVGGFWPVAAEVCALPGDMDLNGQRNGADIQRFVNCVVGAPGASCACADLNANGTVDVADTLLFVQILLGP